MSIKPSEKFMDFTIKGGKELSGCRFVFEVLDITPHGSVVVRPRVLTEDPDIFLDFGPHELHKHDTLTVATVTDPIKVDLKVSMA